MHSASCHAHARPDPPLPVLAYEREPGAASLPEPRAYRRRQPEKTALHAVVRGHLETLLSDARRRNDEGSGYPRFVGHKFRRYLDCGLMAKGFASDVVGMSGKERFEVFAGFSGRPKRIFGVLWADLDPGVLGG